MITGEPQLWITSRVRTRLWMTSAAEGILRPSSALVTIREADVGVWEQVSRSPITVSEAKRLGLTARNLRSRSFTRPWRGVRLPAADVGDLAARCRALALVVHPEAAMSHETALQLQGLPGRFGAQED